MANPVELGRDGKCPHCGTTVQFKQYNQGLPVLTLVDTVPDRVDLEIHCVGCPSCQRPVVAMNCYKLTQVATQRAGVLTHGRALTGVRYLWPKAMNRNPVAAEVPLHVQRDYEEAAIVLADSEKASAALSRRCLQTVLREAAGVKPGTLWDEIEQTRPKVPAYLGKQLHAVREIGNFAAHTSKSTSTGEIVDVEPGEAEWNLDVCESAFDFFYVQPRAVDASIDALNKKLQDAGKKPIA